MTLRDRPRQASVRAVRSHAMGQGISEVLPFAIGVALSPVPIIAVILILFSDRARVNGPAFLLGWVVGLAVATSVVYFVLDAANASTDSTTSDSVSWGKILLGVLLLGLARRNWAKRPAPGQTAELPKWMATVESIAPSRAFGLAVLLSVVNPKNLVLVLGAAAGLGQLGVDTGDAIVAIAVFVVVASLSIAFPVVYRLVGGARARTTLDDLKAWMTEHNSAVMAVLFLVFGVVLISKGLGYLS
jgi:threonine/homoserine/homoserine lactone efflux protein